MRSVFRGRRSSHVMSAFVCGLDVHKDSTYATILNSDGKVVTPNEVTQRRGFLQFTWDYWFINDSDRNLALC